MWHYNYHNYTNELYHHGTKGMKWGIRRYQNADGSLTEEGKKRYAKESGENRKPEPARWVKEDMIRTKRVAEEGSNLSNRLRSANNSIKNRTKQERLDLSSMSDKELRDLINRELLERQYNDVFNAPKQSKGREFADRVLDDVGSTLAVTASALAVALAVKELKG